MKKGYRNKQVGADQEQTKAQPGFSEQKLRCVFECVVPGHGAFKAGDPVNNPESVAYLTGNPNFELTKEGE